MTQVNPPPRLRIPPSLIRGDIEARAYLEQLNTILFQLWNRTGGGEDIIDIDRQRLIELENQVGENFNSFVQQLFKENEGLPEFTVDTTGFTVDSTLITADKVIA